MNRTSIVIITLYLSILASCNRVERKPIDQLKIDGPDKAHLLNYWQIHDKSQGRIPYERMVVARRTDKQSRQMTETDFQWTNWETKIPGRGRVVFLHKSSGTLFTGSVSGGLWRNDDFENNGTWQPVDDFSGSAVNCITQDPNNPNTLYIGTGESFTAFVNYRESTAIGTGIYRSTDAGATWTRIPNTENFFFINDIVIRNENGNSVFYVAAASGEYREKQFISQGLYRSTDQGATWTRVLPNIPGTSETYAVADLELSSTNRLYAATQRNSNDIGGGIILRSDNGTTWSAYSGYAESVATIVPPWVPGRAVIKHAPSNPSHVYAIFTRGFTNNLSQLRDYVSELRQSTDGGVNWSIVPLPPGWANIPWHALSLAVDPQNENKIVIGALDVFILPNTQAPGITGTSWFKASDWAAMYYLSDPNIPPAEKEEIAKEYVHADIHELNFFGDNSNDMLITTDGGVFLSRDMGVTVSTNPEIPSQERPTFSQLNNGLKTTQYYYARLHPTKNIFQAIGGTQDNGSIHSNKNGSQENMISGGDGAYAFWDADHPQLKITTGYSNGFFIHVGGETYSHWIPVGLFINPMDYDQESNLVYSNTATSPFGGQYGDPQGFNYNKLQIFNVNKYLKTPAHGLDTVSYVVVNTGVLEAITAIKLSRHSTALNRSAVIGTENGKVYKITGLPKSVKTVRIDNNKLPDGYISSVDVGDNDKTFLVTISNFGVASVWVTYNGGTTWKNLERNLPDMPVRWGLFNPFDDKKIIIATEAGVWGLENTLGEDEQWKSYNAGLPDVRVDMIDIRKSDSTILAATHGHGLWSGKLNQGDIITSLEGTREKTTVSLYPNPATDFVSVPDSRISKIVVRDLQGRSMETIVVTHGKADVRQLRRGTFLFDLLDKNNVRVDAQKVILR